MKIIMFHPPENKTRRRRSKRREKDQNKAKLAPPSQTSMSESKKTERN